VPRAFVATDPPDFGPMVGVRGTAEDELRHAFDLAASPRDEHQAFAVVERSDQLAIASLEIGRVDSLELAEGHARPKGLEMECRERRAELYLGRPHRPNRRSRHSHILR
jgi:hypothetical protein